MKILVTGAAGFIGMHVSNALAEAGSAVVGIDNLNDYYDPALKLARLELLKQNPGFRFIRLDIADDKAMKELFTKEKFDHVVHLAAQAGVRYSLQNPHAYAQSNIVGFVNILEGCRHNGVKHLVYASSSSVYGGNKKMPFAEIDPVDHPVSLYAATKKANELMAHTYSHLYGLPTTGLRFFTVYGPWGRPDMAYFSFTKSILEDKPIQVFNQGDMKRDFTYIDDIVEGIIRVTDRIATPHPGSEVPYRIFNIGNHEPVQLLDFIQIIETKLEKAAIKKMLPMQDGDVPATYADTDALYEWVNFRPSTSLDTGLSNFVAWYLNYYGVSK